VLVVEDDHEVLDALATLLQIDGFEVATATDGRDALDRLAAGLRPCLILVDLLMPRLNGFQFCEALGRDTALARIPVIICSAVEDSTARLTAANIVATFRKPFVDPSQLLRVARAHC
jgi:CheY-like chemotaxis protein